MKKRNVIITGVSGLLGNNLACYFRGNSQVSGIFFRHPVSIPGVDTFGLDLTNYPRTREFASQLRPDVLIHCASRTDVDKMEEEQEDAWQANVLTTRVLIDALRDLNSKLVYISTDSVYSGNEGHFRESTPAIPLNWYGKTKLESENLVFQRPNSLILRTNLYGWNIQNKKSLAEWFLDKFQSNQPTSGFSDAHFSSIYSFLLAEIIDKCLHKNLSGIYNCACRDSWTKSEFGRQIAKRFGFDEKLVFEMSMDEAGLRARRGKDLSLSVDLMEKDLGEKLPSMRESLDHFFNDWKAGIPEKIKRGMGEHAMETFYPVRQEISYGGQSIDQSDIDEVARVLRSQYLTQGNEVSNFENAVAEYVGAKFGAAVSSGTAALHTACLACGIAPGDEGITSPITFLASSNAIVYCGGIPRFADIDPKTYNMSPHELEKNITEKTRVVIPVHFAGQSCHMAEIKKIISEKEALYGKKIYVIEDASHSLGSTYHGQKVGCCQFSDAAVFSFHPVKHITTGEGGMIVTNERKLADRIRKLRSHGTTREPEDFTEHDLAFSSRPQLRSNDYPTPNPWYYEQDILGFNYRITDIQCALGRTQLKKIELFMNRRRLIVKRYNELLRNTPFVTIPFEANQCSSNFHLYVLQINFEKLGICRAEVMRMLKKSRINTQVHYIPVYLQPYYRKNFQMKPGLCEIAEKYYERCLSLPLYPALTDQEVDWVVEKINEIMTH